MNQESDNTSPVSAQVLVDVMAGNDQFRKLAHSKEFQECLQAIVSWVSGTFESDWTREPVNMTIVSNAGSITVRSNLQRENLVQRVNPSVLKDIQG